MIKSFKCRSLKKLYAGDRSAVRLDLVENAERIMTLLDAASTAEALNLPRLHFHLLKGDLKRFYSVRVTASWRIIFRFDAGHAYDVDLIDYH